MLFIFFSLSILNFSDVFSSDYCEIMDILTFKKPLTNCNESQIVFGSFLLIQKIVIYYIQII